MKPDDPITRYNYIDKTGKIVIEPHKFASADSLFTSADSFSEGLARVKVGKRMSFNFKYGYIDKTGKIVIEPQFDWAGNFSGGLAEIRADDSFGRFLGYIDKTGKYIWESTK